MVAAKLSVSRASFVRDIMPDDDPDLSHLGEYSNQPTDKAHTVDRKVKGDWHEGSREYRYFIVANSASETGNRLSVSQDYKRMEDYNKGYWAMTGIRATVRLDVPSERGTVLQTIKSPGLWGVESDAGEEYIESVYQEECNILTSMLESLGVEVTP